MKTKILFLQLAMFLSIGLFGQKTEMIDDVYFKPGSKSILNNNDVKSKKVVKQQGKYLNGAKEIIFVDRDSVEIVTPDSKYLLAKANDSTELSQNNEDENGGHYLNEFNGSQSDLEYAERIRRFHNPKYTIFIGDPNYSDIYFLNNFDWNVYVDGSYAYVTPTWTNPYWFDYMYRPYSYNNWYWGNSWYSPYSVYGGWGYNNWGSPFYGGWGYNYWGNPYYGSWSYPYYGYGYGYGYGNYGWGYPYYGYHNHWNGGYANTNLNRRNDPMNNEANRRVAGTSRSSQGVSHRMEALTIGGDRTSYSGRNTYTSLSNSNNRTGAGINSGLRSDAGLSGSFRNSNTDNTRSSSIRTTADGMPVSNNRNSGYTTNDNSTNRSDYSTSNRGTYNSSNRQTYSTGSRTGNINNGSSTTSYRTPIGSTAPRTSYSTGTPTRTYNERNSSSRSSYPNNSVSSSRFNGPVSTPSYSGGNSGSSSSGSSSSSSSSGSSRSSGGGGGGRR